MRIFSGFPSGKVAVTPLPNLFFSELLPAIDDLTELKVTLHIFWLIANEKNRAQCVTASELRADRTLMQSTSTEDLARALDAAAARGTLLKSQDDDAAFFVNNETGRRAFEKMEGERLPVRSTIQAAAPEPSRPNIFTLYEQNIGVLTPMIAEELKDAEKEYSPEWIAEAFKIAVEQNVRKWSYVQKILERWRTEGKAGEGKKRKKWTDEYDKFVNR